MRASCSTWSSTAPTAALAAEHWWTIFFPGCDELADVGPEPPDHTFPEAAREHLVGSITQHVDAEHATRYAEVSNDWSAHHFDLESAQRAGVDYVFAHGLCTMAMCTQAAVAMVADGDPSRVRRVAVRLRVTHSPRRRPHRRRVRRERRQTGAAVYAFEATCADAAVVKHGRIELFS